MGSNLIFIGPCIVIYSYSTINEMHLLSQIIYSCKTLYMFRAVFPSIIRSSKLLLPTAIGDEMVGNSSSFDIYRCCIRSSELLMMDGTTETCRAFYKNK